MTTGSMNGSRISDNENKEVMRQDDLAREEVRREASTLVKRVAEGYSALRSLMEQNPWLTQEMDAGDRDRKRAFDEKLQQGLRRANDAPRCRWVRQDGNKLRITADAEPYLLLRAQADDGGARAGVAVAGGGGRQFNPDGADADTKGAD